MESVEKCRLCNKESKDLVDPCTKIGNSNLSFKSFLNTVNFSKVKYPQKICQHCSREMTKLFKMQIRYVHLEDYLLNLVDNQDSTSNNNKQLNLPPMMQKFDEITMPSNSHMKILTRAGLFLFFLVLLFTT